MKMPAYFDKTKKTWYVQFRYKDYTGKLRSTTKRGFERKKDALQYEADFKAQQVGKLDFSFGMLVKRYLEHLKVNVRLGTYEHAVYNLNKYILPFFEKIKVSDITVKTIIDWDDHFLAPKKLADTTKYTIGSRLSAVFNYAEKYYNLSKNPMRVHGSIGSLKRKKKYRIWTDKEAEKFFAYTDYDAPWYALAYRILFYTGIRPCELLAIYADDVDFESNTIYIHQSYHYKSQKNGGGYCTEAKNEFSKRTIYLPEFLIPQLKIHIEHLKKLGYSGRIFPTNATTLNNRIKDTAEKAGAYRIRLYDLRHSHASALIAGNQDINIVAKRMGHCSPETTLRIYSHLYGQKDDEIRGFLNAGMKMDKSDVKLSSD